MWLQQSPSKVLELIKRIKSTIWTLNSAYWKERQIGKNGLLRKSNDKRPPGWEWRKWPQGAHGAHKLVTSDQTPSEELRPFSALLGWCNVSRAGFSSIQSRAWREHVYCLRCIPAEVRTERRLPFLWGLSRVRHSPKHTQTAAAWSTFRVRQRRSTAWWWPVRRAAAHTSLWRQQIKGCLFASIMEEASGQGLDMLWVKWTFRDSEQETPRNSE